MQSRIPMAISQKLSELNKIAEEYPVNIPIPVAAKFLGTNPDSLRCALQQGRCPFGYGWQQNLKGNRGFIIPTIAFYLALRRDLNITTDVREFYYPETQKES